ncbi:AAA ATPase central domain protein [Methylocella silvestris BL2]|uniref:AAA ATPase central domain protein n=1 Tax=Methylocella silvestris (strain DSM 15510 / CIP 108128 / LMG 27833 / NCIMB 13906 / BL2) TaxID=395965 RepID=B8ELT6_METSB|nr:AAA family ATPase [Methylocella silvestris]ACK50717.1 AAA ATPase central domain protein [Methylocella silvestris BL2]
MNIQIERPFVEALVTKFPAHAGLSAQLRFSDKVELDLTHLASDELDFLEDLYRGSGSEKQARAAQLATLRAALTEAGKRYEPGDLEMVLPALVRHLTANAIRGWLFTASVTAKALPYLVTRFDYVPASNDETGKILIELKANAKGVLQNSGIRIAAADIAGRTLNEILAAKGFLRETPELIAAFDQAAERYFEWRQCYGAQFLGRGTGFHAEDPNASHRDTDWSRKDIVVLSTGGGSARLVNDEEVLSARSLTLEAPGDILAHFARKASKSNQFAAEDEINELREKMPAGLFTRLPVHPYILMFHLDLHHHLWVHVDEMSLYRYQPELKNKLVLPPEQTDLIDILTAEMDVLMDDIVEGKSGGTTVLCAGPPGVGKTLTAEVYSEIIQRPLYRVHSGQLGLNVTTMETALKDILTRAQRWGAVMLIDEADVYIKRRDDNIAMNAVVGVFLRVLEYFNGLLFLTTNRVDDIDEAIVSRCIALIKYYPPDDDAKRRIWRVMAEQFALKISDTLIDDLVGAYPAASGRDIKGLAKLAAKYCHQKKTAPDIHVFQRCAVFRGLDSVRAVAFASS